jgi:mannose-6-phosphate isomerase-like protein (cupin superfamily)
MDQTLCLDRTDEADDVVASIRAFAAAEHFRSATVDELEIDGDFCRRPLRPEDLSFIDFTVPVVPETVCDLPSLAANRILRCVYDMHVARAPRPRNGEPPAWNPRFSDDAARSLGARIAPFLERFAFGFLERPPGHDAGASPGRLRETFAAFAEDAALFARALRARVRAGALAAPELRFVLVQQWCLAATKQAALDGAQVRGWFDHVPPADRPRHGPSGGDGDALCRLAAALDVNREQHAFWQFYLPTALGAANYLSALAARPEQSPALLGAAFVAETEWHAFSWLALQASSDLGVAVPDGDLAAELRRALASTTARFSNAVSAVERAAGTSGLRGIAHGLDGAAQLARLARRDLDAQLRWLASIDGYVEIARRLDRHITAVRPDIDRDTFVEPREMCSTTHVHDDHRLVSVESGTMVFWGRPGMRFRMEPGDLILVPRGRLHGSTVESAVCVYHQPIIPDEWVRPLVDDLDRRPARPA